MQGRLIFINQAAGTGLIFGADRNRYRFELADWRGGSLPRRNTIVEFEPAGDTALAVQAADAAPLPVVEAPKPVKAGRPARTPRVVPTVDAVLPGDDLLAAVDALPPPKLSAAPAARLLLTEEPGTRRFRLKPILIGVLLALLLLLCCFVYARLKNG